MAHSFIDGLPINSMVIFHGYVSHNQMVMIMFHPVLHYQQIPFVPGFQDLDGFGIFHCP